MPPRRRPEKPATRSVLMIASEALPFSKTGGLADVLGALPSALARLGWRVTVAVPKYRGVTAGTLVERRPMNIGGFHAEVGFFDAPMSENVSALLIEEPGLYEREQPYGVGSIDYPDNARRFALLTRAALDFVAHTGERPSIVHAHDWQAALAPVYLKTFYHADPVLAGMPSLLTIHNLAYQGLFEPDWLPRLDLPWSLLGIEELEFWGKISFLKGGINYASLLTTVSRQYAREIQTPEWGFGFDGILQSRSNDLVGILNGIDVDRWDPGRDPFLPEPFSADNLAGKRAAKAAVLQRHSLPSDEAALQRPLIGMISRMVDQKGLNLIAAIANELPQLGASFIVLGTGDPRYQDMWRRLAAAFPDRIAVTVGFDEGLAHLIEGGADLFLMPSQFEPCGLNQMYSLRYGTIPVVRRVGGLSDTVTDYAPRRPKSTGFVFDAYTPQALLDTLKRALAVYRDPVRWRAIQTAGMAQDHSWDRSAREYVKIYERAITKGEPNGSR